MLRILRSLSPALAVAVLAAPAAAHAAPVAKKAGAATSKKASTKKSAKTKKKTVKVVYPTVTSISPRKIQIGQKLTVKGTGFKPGKGKSSVAFYKTGQPVIFVKADSATATKLVVTITPKVAALLVVKDDVPVATLLRLRVIGAKMSRTWTKNSRSPIVSPLPNAPIGQGGSLTAQQAAAQVYQTCQDNAKANAAGDNDADNIDNATELANSMDPCNPDTDGDGISDGYEYRSAEDLNGHSAPHYPSHAPVAEPARPDRHQLGLRRRRPLDVAGEQALEGRHRWRLPADRLQRRHPELRRQESRSRRPPSGSTSTVTATSPTTSATRTTTASPTGSSSTRAAPRPGGRRSQWDVKPHVGGGRYTEPPYTVRLFNDVDATNPDTDGDGIPDGADDQDNDGWSNFAEMQLYPRGDRLPGATRSTRACRTRTPRSAAATSRWTRRRAGRRSTRSTRHDHQPDAASDAIPFSWPAQINYSNWSTASPNPSPAPATLPPLNTPWNAAHLVRGQRLPGRPGRHPRPTSSQRPDRRRTRTAGSPRSRSCPGRRRTRATGPGTRTSGSRSPSAPGTRARWFTLGLGTAMAGGEQG